MARDLVTLAPDLHQEAAMAHGQPIFRVTRMDPDFWVVTMPDSPVEHSFADLGQATAFIRQESRYTCATVALRVDRILAVAYLDPYRPQSLFGEVL
jgi:hypothetical protein